MCVLRGDAVGLSETVTGSSVDLLIQAGEYESGQWMSGRELLSVKITAPTGIALAAPLVYQEGRFKVCAPLSRSAVEPSTARRLNPRGNSGESRNLQYSECALGKGLIEANSLPQEANSLSVYMFSGDTLLAGDGPAQGVGDAGGGAGPRGPLLRARGPPGRVPPHVPVLRPRPLPRGGGREGGLLHRGARLQ
eukprot:965111-Prorocentrum_minimum.AAC.2